MSQEFMMPHEFRSPSATLSPMTGSRRALIALLVSICCLGPAAIYAQDSADEPAAESTSDWWTPEYLIDYGIILGAGGASFLGENLEPRQSAWIGPAYDPENPEPIFTNPTVGKPHLEEGVEDTIPTAWVGFGMAGAAVLLAGVEGAYWYDGSGSARQFHNTMVGYAETTALTAAITSLAKPLFGRLRPDFGDRALRYHCSTEPERYQEFCEGLPDEYLSGTPEEMEHLILDGRRSFFSGHSSHSFSLFTYTSLVVGGRYVWGPDATATSRTIGLSAQVLMMATASYVSASRVIDGRHHLTDVITGSLIGLAMANLAYWRRFGLDGGARSSDVSSTEQALFNVDVQPFSMGTGLNIMVRHSW